MQNIDPIYIAQPVIVIAACVALLVYWHRRRGFEWNVLAYAFLAYAAAITLKYAVQIPTITTVTDYFGQQSVGLGLYYGAQTMFFEVGMAYVVALYAVRRGKLGRRDAEGYGAGLAFWENAVLLGAFSLLSLVAYYAILSTSLPVAQTVYSTLNKDEPGLFAPAYQAVVSVALGTTERFSSILIHSAWGYLCVMAAVLNKKRLFAVALPMGLVDFLVPFASSIGVALFEGIVFVIGVISVLVAWLAVKAVAMDIGSGQDPPAANPSEGANDWGATHSSPRPGAQYGSASPVRTMDKED